MTSGAAPAGVNTGRLGTALNAEAHAIVYDRYAAATDDPVASELQLISEVDRAHLIMLAERGIISPEPARALLSEIRRLRAISFAPVVSRPIPRGVYLSYENYLTGRLGDQVGGVLHTGRSRNDLNATTARLGTREPYARLITTVDQLAQALLDQAERYRDVVMPAYTHGQPAVPITYGHYLGALAAAVIRDLDGLLHAGQELDTNPLGAGAVGGTSVPIDTGRTTTLLGFAQPARNSVDAVATRDFVLRLLAAGTVLGTTVTRAARDFSTWTSDEFALLLISDDLVGSSSMMPQKRNPFLLEHISGRAATPLGCFVAAAAAMNTTGYTNAIANGTEAMRHLRPGLDAMTDAATLLRIIVLGATPEPDRMVARCRDGFTTATYLAEQLVADGVPFRSAHHQVGRAVLDAIEDGRTLPSDTAQPAAVAAASDHGGGPGSTTLDDLRRQLNRYRQISNRPLHRWRAAADQLDAAVDALSTR